MANEEADALPAAPLNIKVHVGMCLDLQKLVGIVTEIIPEIEAARPRASGIEALCQISKGVTKAKSLLQRCIDSSVFYSVLSGEKILSSCKRLGNLVDHSLTLIQNIVPVPLAAKISEIILAVRSVVFRLDPPELEARKILRDLLYRNGVSLTDDLALSGIHTVCSRLQILSPNALLIEKSSMRKLIAHFDEGGRRKQKMLRFFLNLLNLYTKARAQHEEGSLAPFKRPYHIYGEVEQETKSRHEEAKTGPLVIPKEFLCPLSARFMLDPVVIASGQTYERAWIQKWFNEGHNTCPKTEGKLDHLSLTPNVVMKDVISNWCVAHRFTTPEAEAEGSVRSWGLSSISSLGSLSACIDNLNLQ